MRLISTVTLATTLLSFVAADVSKDEELYHRVLGISEPCMLGQEQVTNDVPEAYDADYCSYTGGNSPFDPITIECDYSSLAMDNESCTSVGGRAVRLSYDKACSDSSLPMSMTQIPFCLHTACDAQYAEFLEEESEEASGGICEYDCTIEDSSAPVTCANRSSKSDCKSSGCLWYWRRSTPCFACEDLRRNQCNKLSDCTWIQGACLTA